MTTIDVIITQQPVYVVESTVQPLVYEVELAPKTAIQDVEIIKPLLFSMTMIDDSIASPIKAFSGQHTTDLLDLKSPATHNHDLAYEPKNTNIQAHISDVTTNPHDVTAAQVGAYTAAQADTLLAGKSDTTHSHNLDDLLDVVITTPSSGQALKYVAGTGWVNGDVSATGGGVPILQPEDVATITHYAPLSISGNTGARVLIRICDLSDGKQLVITCGTATSTSTECYGTVYDPVANTWGAPTLLFTGASTSIATEGAISIKTIGTDRFLLINVNSLTELQAKVLTVSVSTITVGTAYTKAATLSGYVITNIVSAGSSYVISYQQSGTLTSALALTESAGVVTWGAVVSFTVSNSVATYYLFPISATEVGVIYQLSTTTAEARCLTLSSATIAASTPLSLGGATGAATVLFQKIGTEYIVISQETGQARISFLQFASGAVTARSLVVVGSFISGNSNHSIVNVSTGKYILVLTASNTILPNKAVYILDDGTTVSNGASVDFSESSTIAGLMSSSVADTSEIVLTNRIIRFTYSGGSLSQSIVSFSKSTGIVNNYTQLKGENRSSIIFNKMKTLRYSKITYSGFSIDTSGVWGIVDFSSFPSLAIGNIVPYLYESENNAIGFTYANLGHYLYIIRGSLV